MEVRVEGDLVREGGWLRCSHILLAKPAGFASARKPGVFVRERDIIFYGSKSLLKDKISPNTMSKNIEIPWKKFSEEEIQTFIAMLFHAMEYNLEELHKSDRANECGADIVAKKGEESIAIAVKIKPDQQDRYQLIELSERTEKKKVYIHIQTPTKKFLDVIEKYKGKVEIWDIIKLNKFFMEKNPYFAASIIFDNHTINKQLDLIQYILFGLWTKSKTMKKKDINQIDKESFAMLWRLKDLSVTLYQTNNLIAHLFETPINMKEEELNAHFLKIFYNYLDLLESKIYAFSIAFTQFYSKNKALVNNSVIEQRQRSHWFWIGAHKPLNNLSRLKKELNESIEHKRLFEDIDKELQNAPKTKELKDYEEEIAKCNSIWQAIHDKLKELMVFGMGVESFVDDIASEYFRDHDFLNNENPFEE